MKIYKNKKFIDICWFANILALLVFGCSIFISIYYYNQPIYKLYFKATQYIYYVSGVLSFIFWILNLRLVWYYKMSFVHFVLLFFFGSLYSPIFYIIKIRNKVELI